jgi:hypothetical protein
MTLVRSLIARGTAAVAGLLLVSTTPAVAADPPLVKTLDALLKAYRAYELPEPPADAPLVRATTGRGQDSKGKPKDSYALGFLIRPKRPGLAPRVVAGLWPVPNWWDEPTVVEPRPAALEGVDAGGRLELAVQVHARGWTELAVAALDSSAAGGDRNPETRLARSAWNYWLFAFSEPTTDRAKVAHLLKMIWERHPEEFDVRDRNVVDALDLSLVPGRSKPGTVEALTDGLIEVTKTDRTAWLDMNEVHPAYLELARRSFDAVPALIEHLTDERLTRAYPTSLANFRDYLTVADIVRDLFQGLAGEEVSKEWGRSRDDRIDRADIEAWWADARKVGEEAYFTRHLFGERTADTLQNRLMLDVLAYKYPKQLPDIYQRMLKERPGMTGWELGEAVADSALSTETKRELFVEATRCSGNAIRIDGIGRLLRIDRRAGRDALLTELDRVPATPAGEYRNCREARLTYLVAQVNEPSVWEALEKAAKRVDVGLRMELLREWTGREPPAAVRAARVRFISKFLDDANVRDVSSSPRFAGTCAGSGFPRLEVGNFVADQLAYHFQLDNKPAPQWTDAEWARLRDDVKKALAREGIR